MAEVEGEGMVEAALEEGVMVAVVQVEEVVASLVEAMEDLAEVIADIRHQSSTSLPMFMSHLQMKTFQSRKSSSNNQHLRKITRLSSSRLPIHPNKRFPSYHPCFHRSRIRHSSTSCTRSQKLPLPFTSQRLLCTNPTNPKCTSSGTRRSIIKRRVVGVVAQERATVEALVEVSAVAVIIMVSTQTVVEVITMDSNM